MAKPNSIFKQLLRIKILLRNHFIFITCGVNNNCLQKSRAMLRHILFLTLLIPATSFTGEAQEYIWGDSAYTINARHYTSQYHDILKSHDPVLYITLFPVFTPVKERAVSLRNGEGERGYWLEGNLTHRFVISQGKDFSSGFIKRHRFTLDAALAPRLTRDTSSPLLPLNDKVGVGLDYLIKYSPKAPGCRYTWATVQLHHYSNGQDGNFFRSTSPLRNNYRSGDFSTNYFRIGITHTQQTTKLNLVSVYAGFQREINIFGPLSLSDELERYYGRSRTLLHVQWLKKPKEMMMIRKDRSDNTLTKKTVSKKVKRQFMLRTEADYILDDLSLFPGNRKYRFGIHQYAGYMPSIYNEVGLLLHFYYGRDYFNIRFDDIVFSAQVGIVVQLGRKISD
jgi:hypothetical protein